MLWMMRAVGSRVKLITGVGHHGPQYSSCENLTVTFFPKIYSYCAQWTATATSAKGCRAIACNNWEVVCWHPKILPVKQNRWYIESRISIQVNDGFLSLGFAMGPNSRVGSGSGSTWNRTIATGFTTRNIQTVAFRPVSTRKPGCGKADIFPPIKYFSSDRITT